MAFLKGNQEALKEFDWEKFDKLCTYPDVITQEDIANIMELSKDTCAKRIMDAHGVTFSAYRAKKQPVLRKRLLEAQVKFAEKGNPALLIWLGKNYLGQAEPKTEQVLTIQDQDRAAKEYASQLKELGFKGAEDGPSNDSP